MEKPVKDYIKEDPQTRYFYINWGIYLIAIIASTVYCYGRLSYVRSGPTSLQSIEVKKQ